MKGLWLEGGNFVLLRCGEGHQEAAVKPLKAAEVGRLLFPSAFVVEICAE